MYAETGLLFPFVQNFSSDFQQLGLEDYCKHQKTNASMDNPLFGPSIQSNFLPTSAISDYDLGEGDLFKAPEPVIEEPIAGLDSMAVAVAMISYGEEVIASEGLKEADMESIQSGHLLSEVFYECKKDLMENVAIHSLSEVLDIQNPLVNVDGNHIPEGKVLRDEPLPKSESYGCLTSMDWMHGAAMEPNFLDFPEIDFGALYGMRRAFSEGDVKTLGDCSMNYICSPLDRPLLINSCTSEYRREKLSRYRSKKSKRNFGRKIKYACRKALADSQPRIRGRFAKSDELDSSKRQ